MLSFSRMGLICSSAWVTIVDLSGNSGDSGLGRSAPEPPNKRYFVSETLFSELPCPLWSNNYPDHPGTQGDGHSKKASSRLGASNLQRIKSISNAYWDAPFHRWVNRRSLITRYDTSAQRLYAPDLQDIPPTSAVYIESES
ncbi:hypothetical protein K505DRAFT_334027 [Melanomma pulvis-pyrius CBS 109.77]|uniref:Uncharacterized protein n=1 Tax=Melanomma pulvis-pyrius CBS 109.77 TaxID=1314802 RepID=A0A6A6XNG9_9PLEO|nr:hypothetical protein K505DRAFT_334027 [Melanomma pulvis-pyrius CBS 109.77]